MPNKLPWTTQEIIDATGGLRLNGSLSHVFKGFFIDSRAIEKTHLFIAIKGTAHDGHTFVRDVIEKGVKGIIIEQSQWSTLFPEKKIPDDLLLIGVQDTTKALGDLARYLRRKLSLKVVGLTGSNGKTSTRRMAHAVLNTTFKTHATRGNFNNEIGLPLSLLSTEAHHEVVVLELGMNHFGEIDALGAIAEPDIGMITNVASAHLEGVGSIEGVFKAKSELLGRIKPGGTVILNADDPFVYKMKSISPVPVIFYGLSEKASVRATDITLSPKGCRFTLNMKGEKTTVNLLIPNRVMIYNALCAAALGMLFHIPLSSIKKGLESVTAKDGRMSITETVNHIYVINDAYNANPESVKSAILAMNEIKGESNAFLVIGDMLELGDNSEKLHEAVGHYAAENGVFEIYATGDYREAIAKGAKKGHIAPDKIVTGSKKEIYEKLISRLSPRDIVLVKGSRGMRMETIVCDLLSWADSKR